MCLEARLLATMEIKTTPLTSFILALFFRTSRANGGPTERAVNVRSWLGVWRFQAREALLCLGLTIKCKSKLINEHAVIAALDNTKLVANGIKYAISVASRYERREKDRTFTLPALTIRRNGGFDLTWLGTTRSIEFLFQ